MKNPDAAKMTERLSMMLMFISLTMLMAVLHFWMPSADDDWCWQIATAQMTAACSCVISIILGGKGIDRIRRAMASATWEITTGSRYFRLQTILLLVAFVLLITIIW